jgi:O-antigen/teichoic acid export membrane protein
MREGKLNTLNNLTHGSLLTRNTVLSLIGQGSPLVVAIFAIPLLIRGLGTDRFGILTLMWMVVGYFSLFDLGMGRALTKLVAENLGAGQEQEIPVLVWTSMFLMLLAGLLGTAAVCLFSPWLVRSALKIPKAIQSETLYALYVLALAIPIVISTAGLRGILEAHQRFDLCNAVRIPMGIFTFLGPLLVLPFSRNLLPIVTISVIGRLFAWLASLLLCFYIMPSLRRGIALRKVAVRRLLSFGSWMTVTNIISPLMVYMDRFLIGAFLSVTAVAYYATPYEVVTKLWIFPGALVSVLFPAFSTSFVQDHNRTGILFRQGVKYLFLVLFPLTLVIVTMAHEGLSIWLGAEFAHHSTGVLQWLAVGVFINSLAHIPFALVQGVGRPDLTAKLHLIELPFYLLVVWWLIHAYGIDGAAIAWVARVAVDTGVLFVMAMWFLPGHKAIVRRMALTMVLALFSFGVACLPEGVTVKGVFLSMTLSAFVLGAWFQILSPEERQAVQSRFKYSRS